VQADLELMGLPEFRRAGLEVVDAAVFEQMLHCRRHEIGGRGAWRRNPCRVVPLIRVDDSTE